MNNQDILITVPHNNLINDLQYAYDTLWEENKELTEKIDKAIEELQDLTDEISNKTIIGLNQFLPKLKNIQEILGDKE